MKKKKLTIILPFLISAITASAQQKFTYEITGEFPGSKKILLSANHFGSILLDSASNADGKFNFKGTENTPKLGTLIVEREEKEFSDYFPIFIEPGKLRVELYNDGNQIKVSGSKNNEIMFAAESENQDFYANVSPLYDSLNNASKRMFELRKEEVVNPDSIKHYQEVYNKFSNLAVPYVERRSVNLKKAFAKYPNTLFTAYYAMNSIQLPIDSMKAVYKAFDENIKNSEIGKEWHKRLFEEDHLTSGELAPVFRATDMNGKVIALEDYKGKYVLLDFWATWCGPCRAGNPHLIEVYNKYKDSGLEIIGIADDDKNVAGWKKAIKDDGIGIWPQVLRGRPSKNTEESNNDLSEKYKVHGYPTKILIDKDGKIVGQFSDDELDKKLAAIFASK